LTAPAPLGGAAPSAMTKQPAPRIGFISLGCPKNLVDSERLLSRLGAEGYAIAASDDQADLVIVNTCGFITPAVEESLEVIGEALRETGRVIVTGCLGAREAVIREAHPEVLAVTGPGEVERVLRAVREVAPPPTPFAGLLPVASENGLPRIGVKLTPRHYAYLKIAEGCDHSCSFCIIPSLRGGQVSRDASDVLAEAERLVAAGARELLVIAQDTSAYGRDLGHRQSRWRGRAVKARIGDLLSELGDLGAWIRVHYAYPAPEVDTLLPLMAARRILPYLDTPLQHASPAVLKRMRRPGGPGSHLHTVRKWRQAVPGLIIRSTFIVGFPGETEADFALLEEFLEAAQLDRVGVFQYSEVNGARANALDGHVPAEVKEDRYHRLMVRLTRISSTRLAGKVGSSIDVLVDQYGESRGQLIGRSEGDSPGIDGLVRVRGAEGVKIGDLIRVRVTGSDVYDLSGEFIALAVTKESSLPKHLPLVVQPGAP